MRTIQKILWYEPFSEYIIEKFIQEGLYNGIGTKDLNLDKLVDVVIDTLEQAKIFDKKKSLKLKKDLTQLIVRHDLDTHLKIGFLRSNRRLAVWIYKLLYKFPFKYRILAAWIFFYSTHFTKQARLNYKK